MLTNCSPDKWWGQHLILNCKSGSDAVTSKDAVAKFIDELVEKIDMEKHGELVIDRFGEGKLVGISACQFIKTSSIVGHFCDESHDFYLDIFSCKRFSAAVVVELVLKHFTPTVVEQISLDRGV